MKKQLLYSWLLAMLFCITGASNAWGAPAFISYNGDTQDTSTTIGSTNVSSGTAGKISWTGTSCTWSSSRLNIAANGSITFTASSGYNITKIELSTGTSSTYYGTWSSSPSATISGKGSQQVTFDNLSSNSVTITTTSAYRLTGSGTIKIYYEAAKTNPTITFNNGSVRVGQNIDLSTLFESNSEGAVTYSITEGGSYASLAGTTLTGTAVGSVTVKAEQAAAGNYNAGEASATITVNAAKILSSIAVTTAPSKTTYTEGETFDPTGMVVTATYSDSSTDDVTASCTFSPSTSTALTTSNTEITVSYTENAVEKTTTQTITVNAASAYTVTFNAGTGSCGTSSLTEASAKAGVTLPTPTIGVTGWSFAGWATASTTNTDVEPTLYAAGATYNPTEDCTLYAVYKLTETSATTYKRATSVSDITGASSVVIVSNANSKVLDTTLGGSVTAPTESSSKITAPEAAIFMLTGNNTVGYTLTNGTTTIGATSTSNSTVISSTTTNDLWIIKAHNTSNTFYFENTALEKLCLENYNSGGLKWMVYAPSTPSTNASVAMKVYVPVTTTVYNSNPAAIVNPTIAWTTAGDKSLYLKNIYTYDNAANVTGIAKTPTYTSSDETVATVSEAGVVTALKTGTTTIKATVEAEAGVNTKAEVSYVVTVKDASNVAGIKAITSTATVVTFTADLTDAVVTYVKDGHAFIQDASGAVYASCGSSLTAGKKINGAVSGSVKAANQIDEITAIDLSGATQTDGDIPDASVISAATLAANKADYEGKLVSIEGATVTASLTSGYASSGKISDDGKTTEINLYAPDSNIEALKDAEGTFNGYITLYGGSTIRFNIFDQSQITLTKNAPTAQTLNFASDAVELDEETSAYSAFTGQEVSGAVGDVTYSIDSDDDGVVTSIDDETGTVVLSGEYGTATIKASAAAKEVTEAGITTPYTATTKTYTITVYPRYTVTFSVNGDDTERRQASHGSSVAVPVVPADILGYKFMGWSTSTVAVTDEAPSMADLSSGTVTPASNSTYYAVFAVQTVGDDENVEFYKNEGSTGTDATSGITASGNINTNSSNGNSGNSFGLTSVANKTATFTGIDISTAKSASLKLDYRLAKSGSNYSSLTVTQYDSEDNVLGSPTEITGSDQTYHTSGNIALNTACVKITIVCTPAVSTYNTFVDNVIITVTRPGITYKDYLTTIPTTTITLAEACTDGEKYYGTYSNLSAFIVPKGLTVSTIGIDEEGKLDVTEYAEGDIVKANTGVMVSATSAGDKSIATTRVTGTENGDNLLKASGAGITAEAMAEANDDCLFYRLTMHKGTQIGFWWGAANGAAFNLAANKAYLAVPNAVSARVQSFWFTEETTGIESLTPALSNSEGAQAVYDLQGRKVQNPKRGLYIINGKKVVIK